MTLDMTNSDASSATVRVLVPFYLFVATKDTSSFSARTSVIHREIFNVPLSTNKHNDLFNSVKYFN